MYRMNRGWLDLLCAQIAEGAVASAPSTSAGGSNGPGSSDPLMPVVAAFATVLALVLGAPGAYGQEGDDAWEGIEEMLVVGESGDLSEAPTPGSAVVFSEEDLVLRGIASVGDIAEFTPNVEINMLFGASSPEIFIRGVGLKDTNANASSSVAVLVDGVPLNSPVGQLAQFFDVEQVEVLRGPQGGRLGRNAAGGAIAVRSRKPSGDFGARALVTYGRFNQVDFETALEMPIVRDILALRLAGRLRQRDPIGVNRCGSLPPYDFLSAPCNGVSRTPSAIAISGPPQKGVNDRDNWGLRGILRFTPSEEWEILLNIHGGRNRGLAPSLQNGQRRRPRPLRNDPLWRDFNGYWDRDRCLGRDVDGNCIANHRDPERGDAFAGDYNGSTPENVDLFGTHVRVERSVGQWTFMSLSAYERNQRLAAIDFDATPRVSRERSFDDRAWQFTQELRAQWADAKGRLEFEVGALFLHEELEGRAFFRAGLGRLGQVFDQDTTYFGAWGQGRLELSEEFAIEGAIRLNRETKSMKLVAFNQLVAGGQVILEALPPFGLLQAGVSSTDLVPTGEIVLQYTPVVDVLFFSKFVRGYKGRHINAGGVNPETVVDPTDQEFVNAFEIGAHTSWLDGILDWRSAVFVYLYEGQQVFTLQSNLSGGQPLEQLINANDSRIFGAETELGLDWEGFRADLSIGVLHATYSDFVNRIEFFTPSLSGADLNVQIADYSGNPLVNAPRFSLTGSVAYTFESERLGSLTPRLDYRYRSRVYFTPEKSSRASDDPRWILDARLDYRAVGEWLRVGFWVRNLLNEIYRTNTVSDFNAAIGDPRTWGVTMDMAF